MWVVKIGGSLLLSDQLGEWLDVIGCYGGGSVVIVPGGGLFADQVRATQQHWHYDDGAAHHMTLLAMEQYGVMMTGLRPDLVLAISRAQIVSNLNCARVPVWLPRDLVLADSALPRSWEITSDSLAIWLAQMLGAPRVLLVKCCSFGVTTLPCKEVNQTRIVDPFFCELAHRAGVEAWICGAEAHQSLRDALYAESGCGTRIVCTGGDLHDVRPL